MLRFFNVGTTDIWDEYFSVVGGYFVHCRFRVFTSSTSDVSSSLSCDNPRYVETLKTHPQLRIIGLP